MKINFYNRGKYLLVIVSFFLLQSLIYPQEFLYKVISYYGNPGVIKNNVGAQKNISVGDLIQKNDVVVLNQGDYIYLADKEGKSFFFKDAGKTNADKIAAANNGGNTSALKKFTDYLASEIVKKKKELGNMKNVGAVTRKSLENTIVLNVPFTTKICDPVVKLSWYNPPKNGNVKFQLFEPDNSLKYSEELKDTFFLLDIAKQNIEEGKTYKWLVESVDNSEISSDTAEFVLPPKAASVAVIDTLNSYKEEIKKYDSPTKYIVLATYYERHGYFLNAMNEYENAVSVPGGSKAMNYLYIDFLLKQGMDLKAMELWEKVK